MNGLDRLNGLYGLDGLNGLDRLDRLDWLSGLNVLNGLKRLNGLSGLNRRKNARCLRWRYLGHLWGLGIDNWPDDWCASRFGTTRNSNIFGLHGSFYVFNHYLDRG